MKDRLNHVPFPLQVSVGTLPASRKTCTSVPVVNTFTTVPVLVSISAVASRTSWPVILLISSNSSSDELANNCW